MRTLFRGFFSLMVLLALFSNCRVVGRVGMARKVSLRE